MFMDQQKQALVLNPTLHSRLQKKHVFQRVAHFEDYLKAITFRWIKPQTPFPHSLGHMVFLQMLAKLGLSLDRVNTVLPWDEVRVQKELVKLTRHA